MQNNDPQDKQALQQSLKEREEKIAAQEQEIARLKEDIELRDLYINYVAHSWYYKLGRGVTHLRQKIAPDGSRRYRLFHWLSWPLRGTLLYGVSGMLRASLSRLAQTKVGRGLVWLMKSLLPSLAEGFHQPIPLGAAPARPCPGHVVCR